MHTRSSGRLVASLVRRAVTVGRPTGLVLVVAALVASWVMNVAAGGANSIPPHAFYLPILVAGIRFGRWGAAGVSLAAAGLAGPLLPADVGSAVGQPASDWLVRGVFFLVLGQIMTGIVAVTVRDLRAQLEVIRQDHELATALHLRQLYVVYQPIVALDGTQRVVGVEALLRWKHPVRGEILPGEFIPLAERSGLIVVIGQWVMEQACRQVQAWRLDVLREVDYFKVAVNVSTTQLAEPGFPGEVAHVLAATGLPASWLSLEITETALVADIDWSAEQLDRVKAVGVNLAIDDFGTGYASLTYVQRFRVDVLKIDRSFVVHLDDDSNGSALAGGIVMLARSLGIRTVGEGVETARQAELLRDVGCDFGQGWLFGRPQPAGDIERRLRAALAPSISAATSAFARPSTEPGSSPSRSDTAESSHAEAQSVLSDTAPDRRA